MWKRAVIGAVVSACLWSWPAIVTAQAKGDVEVFLGPDYLSLDLPAGGQTLNGDRLGMWGLHGAITYYFDSRWGIVVEGSFPQGDLEFRLPFSVAKVQLDQSMYLGGIQYRFNNGSRWRPSAQAMIGWFNGSLGRLSVEGVDQEFLVGLDDSGFAFGGGGNLDLRLGTSFALRLLHAGLVWTSYGNGTQTNPRLSFGIVGRF